MASTSLLSGHMSSCLTWSSRVACCRLKPPAAILAHQSCWRLGT